MYTLVTGGSGFLGNRIINKLIQYKHNIVNLSRSPSSFTPNNLKISISEAFKLPDYIFTNVIHVAAYAHKDLKNESDKIELFNINVKGTINLISALTSLSKLPSHFVYISSVSVYGLEEGQNISEQYICNPTDAYGLSKLKSEELLIEWCEKNNIILTILRLPLIFGKNAPGNIKSMINAINNGYYFNIHNCYAKKSVVFIDDVAEMIPNILEIGGIYNLTDGYNPEIKEISKIISIQLGKKEPKSIPYFIAKLLAFLGDFLGQKFPLNSKKLKKITSTLTFDDSLARVKLHWNPRKVIDIYKIK